MCNLGNQTDKHRGREGNKNKIKTEREINHKRLFYRKQIEGCWGGGGWQDGVTGWWALRRAFDGMSTGCYVQLMNH